MPELPLVTVQLASADGNTDDDPLLIRLWVIPPQIAEDFAETMTQLFGRPVESLSTVGEAVSMEGLITVVEPEPT